ncbi:MAG TPA: hypothetical protein VJB64_01280 [Patescibacteria group bacterium]|nr:hypothetical protein [Patescibacteria group bacterium]
MSESEVDPRKASAMCPHGNFPGRCPTCLEQQEPDKEQEPVRFQERDPFDDFLAHIDQGGVRREPTPEERERMDRSLVALGNLFEGAQVRWQLDGAINISLLSGDYIGIHKDIDLSIDADDLESVEKLLEPRGYALFLSSLKDPTQPRGKKMMERVSAARFREAAEKDEATHHPMIARIDARGMIQEGGDLNFIDTHIVRRDEEHRPIGWGGISLPKEWYEPQSVDVKGTRVQISHPAKVAYFKLHGDRVYDQMDLRPLAKSGRLSRADMMTIRELVDQELDSRLKQVEQIFGRILGGVTSEMDQEGVVRLFEEDTFVRGRMNDSLRGQLQELSQIVVQDQKQTFAALQEDIFRIFRVEDMGKGLLEKIQQVEDWMQEDDLR